MTSLTAQALNDQDRGESEVSLTPLDSLEYCGLELLWETRMHRSCLKLLTF
jgi:hypothetical protein